MALRCLSPGEMVKLEPSRKNTVEQRVVGADLQKRTKQNDDDDDDDDDGERTSLTHSLSAFVSRMYQRQMQWNYFATHIYSYLLIAVFILYFQKKA